VAVKQQLEAEVAHVSAAQGVTIGKLLGQRVELESVRGRVKVDAIYSAEVSARVGYGGGGGDGGDGGDGGGGGDEGGSGGVSEGGAAVYMGTVHGRLTVDHGGSGAAAPAVRIEGLSGQALLHCASGDVQVHVDALTGGDGATTATTAPGGGAGGALEHAFDGLCVLAAAGDVAVSVAPTLAAAVRLRAASASAVAVPSAAGEFEPSALGAAAGVDEADGMVTVTGRLTADSDATTSLVQGGGRQARAGAAGAAERVARGATAAMGKAGVVGDGSSSGGGVPNLIAAGGGGKINLAGAQAFAQSTSFFGGGGGGGGGSGGSGSEGGEVARTEAVIAVEAPKGTVAVELLNWMERIRRKHMVGGLSKGGRNRATGMFGG
jgi:hypothetical protein